MTEDHAILPPVPASFLAGDDEDTWESCIHCGEGTTQTCSQCSERVCAPCMRADAHLSCEPEVLVLIDQESAHGDA